MTLAIITPGSLAPGYNQATLDAFISAELIAAGFTQIFSGTGGSSEIVKVYRYVHNASTYGTIYIRTQVATTGIGVRFDLGPSYNTSTGAIVNGYTGTVQTYTTQINSLRVVHPELRFVHMGTLAIGFFRPATQYSWWSDSNYPFFFGSSYSSYSTRHNPCALSPVTSFATPSPNFTANPPGGAPQMKRAPFLMGNYAWGQYSRDVATVLCSPGILLGNTFEDGAAVFTVVLCDTNTCAIAVRTA